MPGSRLETVPSLAMLARRPASDGPPAERTAVSGADVPMPRGRWKTRLLVPGALIAVTLGLIGYTAADVLLPAAAVRVAPVVPRAGESAAGAPASVAVQAPGWVEADPFYTGVSALTDGVVREVLVLEGARVEAGQVVARLVDDDARLGLAQAEAMLAERQADLAEAEARAREAQMEWDHPIERERKVAEARAALDERRAELAAWPAELAREEADAVYLLADFERIQALHAGQQASDIELIKARQAYEAQAAAVKVKRQRETILKAQIAGLEAERLAATRNLELRIPETRALAAARALVARAVAAVEAARVRRDEAALRLVRMEVHSPAAGLVMTRLVQPGSKVMLNADDPASAQIVRLYDPARLQARVDVPLVDAAKVHVGQRAEIVVDVLPNRTFTGRVTRIVHEADVQKNTLQVKVVIDDPAAEIKPEMLARARFLAEAAGGGAAPAGDGTALFAPESAFRRDEGGQAWAWLADRAARVARRTPVVLGGQRAAGWMEVAQGLRPGDMVIVDAPQGLADGGRIRIVGEAPGGQAHGAH
ncbi:MAG TPA: efflux RND transporter periplasmic adaptor subunit [Phycisphaerae bacterium]|nr:efflux RND transporter periplasmic adaptor subunit [Phycisphaerae bacterium]